ncbi:aldo/keto reductase [Actinomadura luteofluorescens]
MCATCRTKRSSRRPRSCSPGRRRLEVPHTVADELGTTPARVAIAWTMSRSPLVHPIIGARTSDQLRDDLAAVDLTLPPEIVARLTRAAEFTPGFPSDFIAETSPWVFGSALPAPPRDSPVVEHR